MAECRQIVQKQQRTNAHHSITTFGDAKEWVLSLRVACGLQQLSAQALQVVGGEDEEPICRWPGVVRAVEYPGRECKNVVEVSSHVVVWNNTPFCGMACAEFIRQYEQQLEWLETAEQDVAKLKPGNWKRLEVSNRHGCCQRCLCTKTLHLQRSGRVEERDLALYKSTDMCKEWTVSMGVCALCAQTVARHLLAHTLLVCNSSQESGALVVVKKSEGLELVGTGTSNQFGLRNVCEQRSEHCYGMPWRGPLVFWNDSSCKREHVCVFCADQNDAEKRQKIWDGGAQRELLILGAALLPVDIVTLIGSYHLGRCFDSLPIFTSAE